MPLLFYKKPTSFFSFMSPKKPAASQINEPGIYHASALAMSKETRKHIDEVPFPAYKKLKPDSNKFLITDSIMSCFPVIFLFKNGEIGLYHGNNNALVFVQKMLDDKNLEEILLFQKTKGQKVGKALAFAKKVQEYFENKERKPVIKIQTQDTIDYYDTVMCYMAEKGKPVILVGVGGEDVPAYTLEKCKNKDDIVRPYAFEIVDPELLKNLDPSAHFASLLRSSTEDSQTQPQMGS